MRGSLRIRNALLWIVIALGACLLVSCARPPEREAAPCTLTLRAGESLQAAIDRAPAGAVICLPAGTWNESIRVTKPLTLRGAGREKTEVRGVQLARPVIWIAVTEPGAPIVIAGITFTGATGSCPEPRGCAHGLLVEGTAVVQIERCAFSGNAGSGVFLRGAARATFNDSTITNNIGSGLEATDQAQASITASSISRNRGPGIWLAGAARLELARSNVSESESHGLWVRDSSQLVATDSTITRCDGHGILLRDRASAQLRGCTISSHKGTGVWIEHAADATLSECTIEETWDGVEVRGASQVRIAACTISGIRWNGVEVHGTARATILGSTISRGRGSGIYIGGAAQAEISHNRIDSWTTHGILSLSRAQPWGEGNRMWGNGADLAGNLPGSLRAPLVEPSQEEVRFPNPTHATVQEAVDALLPGGRLVLAAGIYTGGVTLGKPLRIEADGIVLLTARSSGESPVLSLVGGADLVMSGVALGYGSEGLSLGANARASLTDCVLSDNGRGIHAADETWIALLRCSLSRNEQGGMWLWGAAQGEVRESSFVANAVCGIGLGGSSRAAIMGCHITESGWNGGIVLRDSAQAIIEENMIVENSGAGVALYHGLCIGAGHVFTGRVEGGRNVFHGNYRGDVCPDALGFLAGDGGELDLRR